MNKGFTLIELLVVVLIIGILAAIALPQYTKAVERSRISEAAQRLGDMATAAQIEFMQTGSFPTNRAAYASTDVAIADGDTPAFSIAASGSTAGATLTATRKNGRYGGSGLQLTIATNGAITKSRLAGNNTEFNDLVAGFGY